MRGVNHSQFGNVLHLLGASPLGRWMFTAGVGCSPRMLGAGCWMLKDVGSFRSWFGSQRG
eukprot:734396-Prymnesium_polylepis.1